jgi:hypothetical protein
MDGGDSLPVATGWAHATPSGPKKYSYVPRFCARVPKPRGFEVSSDVFEKRNGRWEVFVCDAAVPHAIFLGVDGDGCDFEIVASAACFLWHLVHALFKSP